MLAELFKQKAAGERRDQVSDGACQEEETNRGLVNMVVVLEAGYQHAHRAVIRSYDDKSEI